MDTRSPPKVHPFPVAKQRRMDELLERNSEGLIAPDETTELNKLVTEAERLMVANAKRLAEFSEKQAPASSDAVPVTVWVKPEPAGP